MSQPYLLGIDVGTSAIKCVLFDLSFREIAISHRTPEIIRTNPGWSEISMEGLWTEISSAIREVVASPALLDGAITSVGIAGTACGAWLLDGDFQPVRNGLLWNDGRAADILGRWLVDGTLDEIFKLSGNAIFPGYTLPLLCWLLENEPVSLEKTRVNLFCKDWIRYKLTGQIAVEHSDLGYMPYDIQRGDYSDELLKVCGLSSIRRLFPEIMPSDAIAGVVQPDAARETGLTAGIPVVAGLVDVAATTLGSGAYMPGQACSIVGTSFMNNLVSDRPSFEPFGIGVQTRSVNTVWIRSMVNTSGTINLQWFLDQFCLSEQQSAQASGENIYLWAENQAAGIPIGSGGILYHPYLNTTGVISPFVNPTARAQFFGISVEHTRFHLLRAIYEGTALSMLDCYAHFPVNVEELYISGGGARSPFWCQMFSDCTGKNILVPTGSELGARGVAILAGVASGLYPDLPTAMQSVIHVETEYHPNPAAAAKYFLLYELYKSIYQHLTEDWWARHRMLREL